MRLRRRSAILSMLHFARSLIDEPLDDVRCLLAARAAIGADRRGVRHHRLYLGVDHWRSIDERHSPGRVSDRPVWAVAAEICAHRGKDRCTNGEEPAFAVECEGAFDDGVARVVVRQEIFRAGGMPFDRTPDGAGGVQQRHIFRVGLFLRAECTADVVGQDVHAFVGNLEHLVAQNTNHVADALARRDPRVPVRDGVVLGDAGPRFDRIRKDPRVDQLHARDVRRFSKHGIDRVGASAPPLNGDVVWCIGPDRGRPGDGRVFNSGSRMARVRYRP